METPESGAVRVSGEGAGAARVLQPGCRADSGAGGRCQISTPCTLEKLKNWKPDATQGIAGRQNFRFSGFQVFTSSRSPRLPQAGAWSNAPDERQVFGKPDLQCPIFDDGRVLEVTI